MGTSSSYLFVLHFSTRTRNGKAIDRVPLPPPQYGTASLGTSKLSQSSSFHPSPSPSAPFSGRRGAAVGISQPGSSASDNHVSIEPHPFFLSIQHCLLVFYSFGTILN